MVPIYHISRFLSFVFISSSKFHFLFSTIRFSFSSTWDHMGKNSNDISCGSTQQIHSQKIMHTPREGLCQRHQRIMTFQILDLYHLFSLTYDHMGVKVSKDIYSESTQNDLLPTISWPGEGVYQSS